VLPRWKAVIEVQGCFWHAHHCHLFVRPVQNANFWSEKHAANRARDEQTAMELRSLGWRRLVVWECAIEGKERLDEADLSSRIGKWIRGSQSEMEIGGYKS
jgi:DNA mismatch endonuclease (patch repair protein)